MTPNISQELHHEAAKNTKNAFGKENFVPFVLSWLILIRFWVFRASEYTARPVDVYLIDGTYELFRHYYAVPSARDRDGREVGAVRGVLGSLLGMMTVGTTHIGVATDHVIESFRNRLWPGYKTGEGIDPSLLAQFPLLEETLVGARRSGVADGGVRGRRCAGGGRRELPPPIRV